MSGKTVTGLPHALWRIKGTLLIQAVLIGIGIITKDVSSSEHQRLLGQLGFDYQLLTDGHIWHLLTGSWIQVTPGIELSMLALVFGGTFFLEVLAGTWAMLLTCITGDWVATILTALTTRALADLGSSAAAAMLAVPDAGSSAMAHAGYGAVVMLLPRRWLKAGLAILDLSDGDSIFRHRLRAGARSCLGNALWCLHRLVRPAPTSGTRVAHSSGGYSAGALVDRGFVAEIRRILA